MSPCCSGGCRAGLSVFVPPPRGATRREEGTAERSAAHLGCDRTARQKAAESSEDEEGQGEGEGEREEERAEGRRQKAVPAAAEPPLESLLTLEQEVEKEVEGWW